MRTLVWMAAAVAGASAWAAEAPCDRTCLNGFIDQYLAAMVAHDPARLPLAKDVKYTENGQALRLGEGIWGPVNGLGKYKLYFADPTAGQAGFFGVVEENGQPQVLSLRLKVADRRIAEIETIVARAFPGGWNRPEGLADRPAFHETLAPSERRPRAEMVAIANSYFEGLEKATGKLTPFYPDCSRVENGNLTANNPKANNPMSKLSCGAQFDTGFSKIITEVRERRYPLVDEERGLVYAGVVFDHVGGSSVKMADGSILEVKAPGNAPHSVLIAELFKIKNGKIQQIEAVVLDSPYKMPSGWGAGPCGRECLNAMVDRYLDAVVAHDAARLPLAPGVRFTENGQHLELNDGLWNTASERGGYKLYIPDAQAGQVGFFGTIRERGVPAILAVRLKVESGKISEIETLVARSESGAKLLEKLGQPHPSFLETIPPAERASREEVIRVSNMYFSGLERNDGKGEYPFTDDCNRLEDGKQTTNNPDAGWVYDGVNFGALGCKAQFETGFFHFVTRIRDRRFVVVDEERGLGLAFAFFDHAGNLAKGPTKPQTWELAELFKIVKGKIRQIEAVVEACPYGMLSGWSSREDGLSSRARW